MSKIMFANCVCKFPKLFVAEEYMNKKNYSIGLILSDEQVEKFKAQALSAAEYRFPGKGAKMIEKWMRSNQTWPLRETDDGFSITPKRKEENGAPIVLDQRKNLIPADRALPYGGCIVNASCDVFCYTKNGGGIACYLNGVQLVKEGNPIGGAAPAASHMDDFDTLEVTDDDNAEDIF